jgi:hypothetical protein
MDIGDNGLHILAAQQLVEEVCRSDLVSVTIRHLDQMVDRVRGILKKSNTAMNKSLVFPKVIFYVNYRKKHNKNCLVIQAENTF